MKKSTPLFLLMLLTFLASGLYAQTVEELIAKGDNYYKEFNNQAALETFLKAKEIAPDNYEVYWRLSRSLVDIGEHMPTSTSEQEDAQEKTYNEALAYANKAIELAPDKSITYLRRAIANGKIALFKGIFSVGDIVSSVRDDCEKAIKLNTGGPEVQAIAHYVLALTHAKVSTKWAPARSVLGLGWADLEIALNEYKKAEELKPNFVMIYVDYAKALMRDDQYELAKEKLEKALAAPITDEDDEVRKAEAKELLIEVKEELE
jgi:tetratricopeptide (TPR) repeat protein